jgi:hypothetical protein
MRKPANKIRVNQFPCSVEVSETTDASDMLAAANLLSTAKIGEDESRQHATARALAMAAKVLFDREKQD